MCMSVHTHTCYKYASMSCIHSILSGGISLPKCTRTSILELLAEPVLHGSVASIGGERRCGPLIRLRRYAEYDPGFVRGDPSPFSTGLPLARGPYTGRTYLIPFFS
jgi:hypothetical protein